MEDLKLCQICSEPAQYGDGLTWARCSKHQYEYDKEHQTVEAKEEKLLPHDGFPHETVEGLTSIILPIYNTSYPLFHMTGNCIGSIKEHTKLPYEIILIDEVLTPDSSRFWPKDEYGPGKSQPSFDKQFVRDYLEI